MAVAFDAQTASSDFNTSPFTFDHTPVGTPRGVSVAVTMLVSAGNVSAITYGGVAMTIVRNVISSNSAGEQGRSLIAFLGSGIPTGMQTVSITNNGSGFQCKATCVTVTAAADTQVGDSGFWNTDSTTPQVTTTTTPVSLRHGAIFSSTGLHTNLIQFAGMTVVGTGGNGFREVKHSRQTTASSGAFTFGYTDSSANEQALVVLAMEEATPPTSGTITGVQDPNVAAFTGTVTGPVPPTPPGVNRMGGTGAIRKPPRSTNPQG